MKRGVEYCISHHLACDCREEKFRRMEEALALIAMGGITGCNAEYREIAEHALESSGDEFRRIASDARRWDYVRRYLARTVSLDMGGKHAWHIGHPRSKGGTIDEAIDADMEALK